MSIFAVVKMKKMSFYEYLKKLKKPKRPETFEEAVKFLDYMNEHGEGFNWSIRYYGFGEHFTFWAGLGGFIDWHFDRGTAISWKEMKKVIIDSAQYLYDELEAEGKGMFRRKI